MSGALPRASAVVLAGGRSSRYGRDKLAVPLGGRSLLDHAILAVGGVASEVIVVGSPALPPVERLPRVPGVAVRRALDAEPFGGPLVALATALGLAREPLALVVGGDMPTMVPAVLGRLLEALDSADGVGASALLLRGRRQPLPAAVRVAAAAPEVRAVAASGDRSLTALLRRLRTRDVDETEWRRLDPSATTLRDVDLPGDLPRM